MLSNLYGWAMSESLPFKDIKFDNNVTLEEVLNTKDDNETGYILEVDLVFPKEIHEKLKQYPPCPENICPKKNGLVIFKKNLQNKIILLILDHVN
jgi:hypothetical protein